jgi:putative transposase
VEALRADNPVWGKRKLGPNLRQAGHAVSDTTVGRILAHLVRLGRAVPAPVFRRPARAAAQGRRWARRLRGALRAARPGEAVQVDTLSLSFPGGRGVKQFTAVDRLSRWTVAMAA